MIIGRAWDVSEGDNAENENGGEDAERKGKIK